LQIISSTLLQLLDPQWCLAACLLPSPASPPPQPCPSSWEQAGQHLLLFWDPLYSTQ